MSLGYTPEVPNQVQYRNELTEMTWKTWEDDTGKKRPADYKRRARPAPPTIRYVHFPDDMASNSGFVLKEKHYKGEEPSYKFILKKGENTLDRRERHDQLDSALDRIRRSDSKTGEDHTVPFKLFSNEPWNMSEKRYPRVTAIPI